MEKSGTVVSASVGASAVSPIGLESRILRYLTPRKWPKMFRSLFSIFSRALAEFPGLCARSGRSNRSTSRTIPKLN